MLLLSLCRTFESLKVYESVKADDDVAAKESMRCFILCVKQAITVINYGYLRFPRQGAKPLGNCVD